jgi:hypothetical protein
MSNGAPRPTSQELFDQICIAKGEIASLIAADLGYIGIPRSEHIHAASLMIEARMLALQTNPQNVPTKTPTEKAVQRYINLDCEYSAVIAGMADA